MLPYNDGRHCTSSVKSNVSTDLVGEGFYALPKYVWSQVSDKREHSEVFPYIGCVHAHCGACRINVKENGIC